MESQHATIQQNLIKIGGLSILMILLAISLFYKPNNEEQNTLLGVPIPADTTTVDSLD